MAEPIAEKQRRIYYQDIVYHVCNVLDRIDGKRAGHGIVCGTADEPCRDVQDRMDRMQKETAFSWPARVLEKMQELESAVRGDIGNTLSSAAIAHMAYVSALRKWIESEAGR